MSSYRGRHAELYDLFYQDKPYAEEAAFVQRRFQRHGFPPPSRVLEIACGTGRHALALEALGYDVVGVDYSADMIRRARQRAGDMNSQVDFRCADMRELDLQEPLFDVALCLFDSIGYVQTNEAIHAALERIRRHVRPGGVFVVEFWHAAAMLREFDPVRVRRWPSPQGEIVRVSETRLDCRQQLSHVLYTVYELGADGNYSTFTETQTNRYFLVQEMAALLQHAGWTAVEWFAGFEESAPITERTWHVVAVARHGGELKTAA